MIREVPRVAILLDLKPREDGNGGFDIIRVRTADRGTWGRQLEETEVATPAGEVVHVLTIPVRMWEIIGPQVQAAVSNRTSEQSASHRPELATPTDPNE